MYRLTCLSLLLLSVLGTRVPAAEPVEAQRFAFAFRYDIVPAETGKDAGDLVLTCAIPRTIVRRQKVISLTYSQEPARVWDEKGTRYARFEFKELKNAATLNVTIDVDLYRLDFETLQRLKDPSAARTKPDADYLAEEKYLDKDSPTIKRAAAKLKGTDELDTLRKTLDFVHKTLKYDRRFDLAVADPVASEALERRKGVCVQFADVFVALCRANGLHSRVCTGYVASTRGQGNERHAWAEVFLDKYGWIPFDPTFCTSGLANFNRRPNAYFYLSWRRHDPTLNQHHFWTVENERFQGIKIDVKDSFSINRRANIGGPPR